MGILSTLRPLVRLTPTKAHIIPNNAVAIRNMSDHRTFPITPSRWQWTKFKDLLHFYAMLGLIPAGIAIFYANVFIGPAQLSEIPEGYTPKHWEYYKSPITRFLAKCFHNDPQQDYEKYLAHIFMEDEKRLLRQLEKKIKQKIAERNDYQAYYYRPVLAKYHRKSREAAEQLKTIYGD